ncbi:MAG: tripartite tricarboxylate transporter TctB family protein [Burkholderiales bacterium]|nr:tripartite tricarboxylate transporter TctB family protein [Burkholderiales bacterium]
MPESPESPLQEDSRGLKSDRFSGAVLIALACWIAWLNLEFPLGTLADPGPGYVPLLLAVGLGVIGLLVALFGGGSEPLRGIRWTEARRALVILVACAALTFALERIGYRLSVFAFLVFFLGVIERKHPLAVLAVAAGFSIVSFHVVAVMLGVPLPRGPWGF